MEAGRKIGFSSMLNVSSSAMPSRPLTGFHRSMFSEPSVFQYVAVVFGMADFAQKGRNLALQFRRLPSSIGLVGRAS